MIWIFPGSFDPPTLGHKDIIERAAAMCDELIVAVLINRNKQGMFSIEERKSMLEAIAKSIPNVRVISHSGLLADLYKELGAAAIVRGIRSGSDYEYERTQAEANARLGGVETVFLNTKPELACVSSAVVREILSFNGNISAFVDAETAETIAARQ